MRSILDTLQSDVPHLNTTLDLGAATARIEVQSLLQQALAVPRSYLLAHPEQVLTAAQQATYDGMLQRRLRGEPIAHILGTREFFGLNLKVTPDTLIPRPDTELLVELALQRIPVHGRFRVLDLGTGSGAIALALAHARPEAEVTAVDASAAALAVARENALRLGIRNVDLVHSDWFAALAGKRYGLIVSNPPYVAAGDEHLAQGDLRFEPASALAAGADGLDDIRRIVGQAGRFLEDASWLLLEHGYDQAGAVRTLLEQRGFIEVFSATDMAGIERVSGGKLLKSL
ncbi:release factor glutamine methyltransferase [Sideroxyarcus emersonii]|uniref:Release factor glutamine methyltransferase n=1 Tax=Sideroxyarcus emersonii TaxID=2764705 RepID=A0AAN1X7X7_9PROT|nr:peptide chain release factor N(5)-glutamine methyltransferase [Sideroxyarcus emersonii]BCK86401.1 release factor glutamine methyltransferase [Sideroxyarcus emersonii]